MIETTQNRAYLSEEEERSLYHMAWWLRKHPMHRIYVLYGIVLAPHQRLAWRQMWSASRVGLSLSRGLSKTFLDGLYLVDKSNMYSGATSIALTKGFRGGKILFTEACEKIIGSMLASQERCDFTLRSLIKPSNIINKGADLWTIKWVHGSSVSTGPLGQDLSSTSPLRGLRANAVLVLDESADISDTHYTSVISPFGRVARDPVGGAMEQNSEDFQYTKIESGTVRYDFQRYSKYLEECRNKMLLGDHDYAVIEFNYEDAFYYENNDKKMPIIFSYVLNLKDLFQEYESGVTSWDDFLSENKNVVQSQSDQEFPPKLLEAITGVNPRELFPSARDLSIRVLNVCDDPCVIGADIARESADVALVVVRVGHLRKEPVDYNDIIYARTLNKVEFSITANYIRDLLQKFPNTLRVYMDQGGGGSAVRDILWRPEDKSMLPLYDPTYEGNPPEVANIGIPIMRLDAANNESNTTRVNFTKAQMQSYRLLLPDRAIEYENREQDEVARTIQQLSRQFTYIISEPSGNWKKFKTKEQRLKKDLFSATLLAMQGVYDFINEHKTSQEIIEEIAWV